MKSFSTTLHLLNCHFFVVSVLILLLIEKGKHKNSATLKHRVMKTIKALQRCVLQPEVLSPFIVCLVSAEAATFFSGRFHSTLKPSDWANRWNNNLINRKTMERICARWKCLKFRFDRCGSAWETAAVSATSNSCCNGRSKLLIWNEMINRW